MYWNPIPSTDKFQCEGSSEFKANKSSTLLLCISTENVSFEKLSLCSIICFYISWILFSSIYAAWQILYEVRDNHSRCRCINKIYTILYALNCIRRTNNRCWYSNLPYFDVFYIYSLLRDFPYNTQWTRHVGAATRKLEYVHKYWYCLLNGSWRAMKMTQFYHRCFGTWFTWFRNCTKQKARINNN